MPAIPSLWDPRHQGTHLSKHWSSGNCSSLPKVIKWHTCLQQKKKNKSGMERKKKNHERHRTERLCTSLGISSLPRVCSGLEKTNSSPEDNPMKAYSEQSRAKETVLSMASRKHVTEEPRRNLLSLRTPHCRHFRHTPAPADQVKNTVGPLVLLGHAG